MNDRFDAIVIGSGSGGRAVAGRLADAGMGVAMVESELVGGECPYWACMPAKTLLRPVEAVGAARRVPGVTAGIESWNEVLGFRDDVTSGLDDTRKATLYANRGVAIIRGHGRLAGPGRVEVDDRAYSTERVVIATGSVTAPPPIDGLEASGYWTNRETMALTAVPDSTAVLGGGPVGIELGQMLSRYGSRVSVIESGDRLLAGEEPEVGELLARRLVDEGVDVRVGADVTRVVREGERVRLRLAGGTELEAARLVVATGRRPRIQNIGLETVDIEPGEHGIEVDERCRAGEGVWAVGDVTGEGQFTHLAAYQGRIVCADILGQSARADYRAVPRVVFCDPEVAAVGLTAERAAEAGIETVAATVGLDDVERVHTYGRGLVGCVGVLADAQRATLVGAFAVGPLAGEWIHMAVLAVKAQIPLDVLRDTIAQFPTFSEGLITAVRELDV
jgi:pyruvate/2-oxoglutarate dehydrogenase complex dihydrolipoamide dehydrogenase (E3) component